MDSIKKTLISFSAACLLAGVHHAGAADLSAKLAESLPPAVEGENYNSPLVVTHNRRETLTFNLISGPRGLRISRGGRVSWQPDYDVEGEHAIVFTVSDGASTVTLQTVLQAQNTNRPPSFTSRPMASAAEGRSYYYRYNAVDPDGDSVNVDVAKKPSAMTVEGDTLAWEPGYDDAGAYDIELVASDGDISVSQKYTLIIQNTNRLPVIENLESTTLTIDENSKWQLPVEVSDPDGDNITLALENAPVGMKLSGNTINWQPGFEQSGSYPFTLIASDGQDDARVDLTVNVSDVNRIPHFISEPETGLTETEAFSYNIRAFDADGAYLQFELLEGPEQMRLSGTMLNWQTTFDDAGSHPVVISVTDGDATVTQEFELTVANKNRPPEFLSEAVSEIRESERFEYTIDVIDEDGQPLELSFPQLPEQIQRDGNTLSWQTDFESAGDYPVRIIASDGESQTEQAFTLQVTNANHKPAFTSKPPTRAIEAIEYRYAPKATDQDGEALTFTLQQAPDGMRVANNTVLWRPRFGQSGEHDVVLAVSDGIDTVTQSFTVKASKTNREPVLMEIKDQAVTVGDDFEYRLEASDPEGSEVQLGLIRHPAGMEIQGDELVWEPREEDVGQHTVIVSASDGDLLVRKHFVITVEAADE